jgi:hypothetical protein
MSLRNSRSPVARTSAIVVSAGLLFGGAVVAQADSAGRSASNPAPSFTPIPNPQATITIITFLAVDARAARKPIPRNGNVSLVQKVSTDPAQDPTIRTRISVTPKRARPAIKVRTRDDGSITVRTQDARKARVRIGIRADGADTRPTTWVRSWRVR